MRHALITRTMCEHEDTDMSEVKGHSLNDMLRLVLVDNGHARHSHFISDFGLHRIDATGLEFRGVIAESRETTDNLLGQFKATVIVEHATHHATLTLVNPDTARAVDGLAVIPHLPRDIEVSLNL